MKTKHFSEKMISWLTNHPSTQSLELNDDSGEFEFVKDFMDRTDGSVKTKKNNKVWVSKENKIKIVTYDLNERSWIVIERSELIKLLNYLIDSINEYLKGKFGEQAVLHDHYSDPYLKEVRIKS